MGFLKVIIFFLLMTSLMTIVFNKKFEKSLVYSLFFSSFILYLSQLLFKTFNVGYYLLLFLCTTNIFLIIREYKKDKLQNFKSNYFNYVFYSFLIICAFVTIYDLRRGFTHWDEFSHWGVMIKEMFRLDSFYTEKMSSLMAHKDYPPILQMYELLCIKIFGNYSETLILRAIHLFEFSIFLYPVSDIINKSKINKYIKVILIPIAVLLLIVTFDGHGIVNTIYVDYVMALIAAFGIFLVLDTKKYDLFNISLFAMNNSFLLLIKQMGLPLYLIICFFLVTKLFINNYDFKNSKISLFLKSNLKNIIILIIVLIIPLLFMLSWSKYTSNFDLEKQFVFSDIKVSQLYDIKRGIKGEQWQRDAMFNYRKALFDRSISTTFFGLSFLQSLVLSIFVLQLAIKKCDKNDKVLLFLSIIIGAIGYTFAMLNLYVFCFGPREGPILASFDRYMATYILIILFVALFVFIKNNNEIKRMMIILLILCVIQSPSRFLDMCPVLDSSPSNMYEEHAKNINKYAKLNDKIFIVAQDSVGDYQYYIKYYLDGITTNLKYYNVDLNDEISFDDDFKSYLKDFDYLYLAKINEKYIEKYSFLFDNSNIQQNQMYKIENKEGNLKLELIGE